MTKKRSPIDVDALAALAAPQPDPVRTVLAAADGADSSTVVQLRPTADSVYTGQTRRGSNAARKKPAPEAAGETMPTGRAGKVGIQVWVDPEKRRRLRHYCTDAEITMDALVAQALDEFMSKHGIN